MSIKFKETEILYSSEFENDLIEIFKKYGYKYEGLSEDNILITDYEGSGFEILSPKHWINEEPSNFDFEEEYYDSDDEDIDDDEHLN